MKSETQQSRDPGRGAVTNETQWVLVPREPTPEMANAVDDFDIHWGYEADGRPSNPEDVWRAMIAASPSPPAGGGERVGWMVYSPKFGPAFFHDEVDAKAQLAELGCDLSTVSRVYAAPDAAQQRIRELEEALGSARVAIVCALAFLARDLGTERLRNTASGVIAELVKADNAIRARTALGGSNGE